MDRCGSNRGDRVHARERGGGWRSICIDLRERFVWAGLRRTVGISGCGARLPLLHRVEIVRRVTVGIDYSLRKQIEDSLTARWGISREYVIESSVLAR